MSVYAVDKLIEQTRKLAAEYRRMTGQPLPVTVEIANFDAARLLQLELVQPPPGGYDAVGLQPPREGLRYQIKGRAIFDEKRGGQRIGQLKLEQAWDAVLLVLLDEQYQPYEIYEAGRAQIEAALAEAEEGGRGKRGAMSVARFRHIATLVWCRESGAVDDKAIWDNTRDL
ncbi:MAG: hypothetical protein OQL08_02525 [Gammaproteobacteria bacterium]|nr:hypothetical protein [Gammaproteobacteria bacterium]